MKKTRIKIFSRRWPREIRLLVNKDCNYNCSFPGTCLEWCHKDGLHSRSMGRQASIEDFMFVTDTLRKEFKLKKAKIGAMEPLLFPEIERLILEVKKSGYQTVSLTTNGYFLEPKLEILKKSKLDVLTVSMHAFNRKGYKRITRVDGFDRVKSAVEHAAKMGFGKIKINRVLLNFPNVWDDLMRFFDWAQKNKISTIKLYKLIWSKSMDEKEFFEHYLSWEALMVFLQRHAKLDLIKRYTMSGRERMFWKLDSGLMVETDIFDHKLSYSSSDLCRQCKYAAFCQEGLMSYGLELNSELVFSGCILRENLTENVWREVHRRDPEGLVEKVNSFIGRLTK